MEALAVLVPLAIIGFGILMSLGSRKLGKSLNRSVFSKGSYQTQQKITSTVWLFETTASVAGIKEELRGYVAAKNEIPKVLAALHIYEETDTHIIYRMGNSVMANFIFVLSFFPKESGLKANLQITNWMEMDGVSNTVAVMEDLVSSVQRAFKAADPYVRITEIAKKANG